MSRAGRYLLIALFVVVCFMALNVIFGLFPIIVIFAWFWWAQPLPEPDKPKPALDDIDAEYEALIREAS